METFPLDPLETVKAKIISGDETGDEGSEGQVGSWGGGDHGKNVFR